MVSSRRLLDALLVRYTTQPTLDIFTLRKFHINFLTIFTKISQRYFRTKFSHLDIFTLRKFHRNFHTIFTKISQRYFRTKFSHFNQSINVYFNQQPTRFSKIERRSVPLVTKVTHIKHIHVNYEMNNLQ